MTDSVKRHKLYQLGILHELDSVCKLANINY